tara:strand:- start:49 stop:558 length:510 start_codon:yes stop_codon:yes gene_type:complete
MIVDRSYQNILFPFEQLPVCGFPVVKLKHTFDIILSWEEIIKLTNKSNMENRCIKHWERDVINYQVKQVECKKLKPIKDALKEFFPNTTQDTDLYGSFENSAGGFKLHSDIESTILHVQQGEVIINVVTGSMSYIFDMKQNDMIYIKRKIKHAVIGLTPRFLTSYGIHY